MIHTISDKRIKTEPPFSSGQYTAYEIYTSKRVHSTKSRTGNVMDC